MLLVTHVLTGAVIGQKISDPIVLTLLALGSHFLLDWIPHWSYNVPKTNSLREFVKLLPDILPSILIYVVFIFSYPDQWVLITLGVTMAILPDFITLTRHSKNLSKIFEKINYWHGRIQVHDEKILGLVSQVIYVALLIIILYSV
ncbi:hypothetical protein IID19_00280 [Patescibacteria group bacterium]|nr:hypothetical protein [Patescibacteria group bacterium]